MIRRCGPGMLYLFLFFLLTYPSITLFGSYALTDDGDGLQNLWNLWWVHHAVMDLHQFPWFTRFLHFPYGTSLIGHTLNPFNGFVALMLLPWFSLAVTYNLILTGSFVATGWATFLLARRMRIRMAGSLLSGSIVTFSSYHFAHAQGHLQLVSFEWVPIFFLCWMATLEKSRLREAAGAAIALGMVLLCDYYYSIYALLGAAILSLSYVLRHRQKIDFLSYSASMTVFLLLSLLFCGPMVWAFARMAHEGVPAGVHPSALFSLDLLAPFVPGGHWRLAEITKPLWSRWSGNIHENSVYLGWTVIGLAILAWRRREERETSFLDSWFWVMLIFFILALGPFLHVGGIGFHGIVLPYRLMEAGFPWLRISGCPVRMMSMVVLAIGLAAGAGFSRWLEREPGATALTIYLLFMSLEYWPRPLPATRLESPSYIQALAMAPPGAAIDAVSSPTWMLYYQTIHEKPLGLGYISRVPVSVQTADQEVIRLYQQGNFQALHGRFGFRYLLTPATNPTRQITRRSRILYDDGRILLVDLSL